ncbi:hypothetical protein FHX37_3336 [Haloactinospora alba]|uniref:Uncharacterized protein n=1 Tax=Haloactinospora alba TaxID=405555 RepID=A0A543NNB5_9ACTN|nr:hypothetical protein [Haloactinospora alba]TQN33322.1 hypothetical protein FHX37_3336 [Haloactinospora alba]
MGSIFFQALGKIEELSTQIAGEQGETSRFNDMRGHIDGILHTLVPNAKSEGNSLYQFADTHLEALRSIKPGSMTGPAYQNGVKQEIEELGRGAEELRTRVAVVRKTVEGSRARISGDISTLTAEEKRREAQRKVALEEVEECVRNMEELEERVENARRNAWLQVAESFLSLIRKQKDIRERLRDAQRDFQEHEERLHQVVNEIYPLRGLSASLGQLTVSVQSFSNILSLIVVQLAETRYDSSFSDEREAEIYMEALTKSLGRIRDETRMAS